MTPQVQSFLLAVVLSLVLDVAPQVKIQFLSPLREMHIFCAAPSGVAVGRIVAIDAYNPDSRLSFTIEDGLDSEYFIVNKVFGDITTQRYIDRPVGAFYNFSVAALAKNDSERFNVAVKVTNYNRFPPVFEKPNYMLLLHRSVDVGTVLTTVVAKDDDVEPYNSKVYYKVNETDIISVESDTGVIKLAKPLPLLLRNFTAILRAEDTGSPQRGSETVITILFRNSSDIHHDRCPAETIRNNRGTFHWVSTEYGGISKLECPFGVSETYATLFQELNFLQKDNDEGNHNVEFKEMKIIQHIYKIQKHLENEESSDSYNLPIKNQYQFLKNHTSIQNVLRLLKSGVLLSESGKAFAARKCTLNQDGEAKWQTPVVSICKEEGFSEAEKIIQDLESMTNNSSSIDFDIYFQAIKSVEKILPFSLIDTKLAQRMFHGISNIMNMNESILQEQDINGTISQLFLEAINEYAHKVIIFPKNKMSVKSPNLALEILDVEPSKMLTDGISYSPHYSDVMNETLKGQDTSIKIPAQVLNLKRNKTDLLRIQFGCFQNSKFFRQFALKNSSYSPSTQIYQKVLTASISNVIVNNLTEMLEYTIPNFHKKLKHMCVYWEPKSQNWLSDGLKTNQTDKLIICQSTHMTAFSVLFDLNPGETISEIHKRILSIISYLGSTLSLTGLVLTITTYGLFRCLNRDHSGKILLNLCISLFFMNLSFLLGSFKQQILYVDICIVVAILVHYFVLTSLCWMFVEAINMYQLLITVFATSETKFIFKRVLAAWGIPLAIVATTFAIDFHFYETDDNDFCLLPLKNPYMYYTLYLGPCCTILGINCVVFLLVSRVLFQNRHTGKVDNQKDVGVKMTQVRGAFTVMTLLGITWIFGAFAVGEMKLIFQYIFCISNSLQGFIIFLVRCVYYPEAQAAWLTLTQTGKLKKYRGVPGSLVTNSSSHSRGTSSSGAHLQMLHNGSPSEVCMEKNSHIFVPEFK